MARVIIFLLLLTVSLAQEMPAFWMPSLDVLSSHESTLGVRFSKKEEELNGKYRFLVENLLSEDECQVLLDLAAYAELGSGVDGLATPHTVREEFRGLTVQNLNELLMSGSIPASSARLMMDKSDSALNLIKSYFNLTRLYFDYTHLVCRTVISDYEGYNPPSWDLSHPIHGDNCYVASGRCIKRSPAFTWRDYSAVIYLNGDIDGGEFFFTDLTMQTLAKVPAKCGRMVAFSSDTLHGVKAVTRGTRCALALWMTMDPMHEEKTRIKTHRILEDIETKQDFFSSHHDEL